MSEIVYGDTRIDAWVAERLGIRLWPTSYSIANFSADRILGAAVFHNFYPENGVIEISCFSLSPLWMSKKMINAVFSYAFDHLKCQLAVLRVSEINARMVNIAKGLGFSGYLIPRLRGRNEAEHIFTLTDDQWRSSKYRRLS